MSVITEWIERMEKIKSKLGQTKYLEKHCPYKCDYFCNGRVNKTKGKSVSLTDKEPCEHFKNGRCGRELHLARRLCDDFV